MVRLVAIKFSYMTRNIKLKYSCILVAALEISKRKYKKYLFPETFDDIFASGTFPKEKDIGVKNLYSTHFIFNHNSEKFKQKNLEIKWKKDPPPETIISASPF